MSITKALRERAEPLTVAELAALLRVAKATVQRWARKQQIPSIRIGNIIRFDGTLLASWVEVQVACTHPIIRPFLDAHAPEDPGECQMLRIDLAELAPTEVQGSALQEEPGGTEPQ